MEDSPIEPIAIPAFWPPERVGYAITIPPYCDPLPSVGDTNPLVAEGSVPVVAVAVTVTSSII